MKHARMDYDRIQDPKKIIPADEPVFLIRAQDSLGARTVRKWADMFEQAGGDKVLVESVRAQALLMEAWPKKKLADVPAGTAIAQFARTVQPFGVSAHSLVDEKERAEEGGG